MLPYVADEFVACGVFWIAARTRRDPSVEHQIFLDTNKAFIKGFGVASLNASNAGAIALYALRMSMGSWGQLLYGGAVDSSGRS